MSIESRIQEQRTNEAIKKNYMGMEGKLYLIAKYAGDEIVKQSEAPEILDFDSIYETDPVGIPYLDEESYSTVLGYNFNGLPNGLHLEITTSEYENKITVYYKSYLVYQEEGGNLISFIPHKSWEEIIEKMYKQVHDRLKEKFKKIQKEEEQLLRKMEKDEVDKLRSKWGDIF